MTKKYFIILGLLFVLQLVFLGCRASDDKKITIWTSLRPVERQLLQVYLDRFAEQYPSYIFRQIFYAPEELRTNFIISALAGKGPAAVHCASDFIGPLTELEVIKPLEQVFDSTFLANFIEQPFPANTRFKGHLYQIADRVGNHLCLIYNKDMIKVPPQTISELIALGRQLVNDTDNDGRPDTYVLAWNYTEPAFVAPFIGGYGGWIISDTYQPTLNTEPVRQAAQLIYDLANKHKVIPRECDYETANAMFLDRRVAMIINGPWSFGTYIKNDINIGLARIPKIDQTGLWPSPTVFPMGYCLNANLKEKKLAVTADLIRYLTSPEVELDFARQFNIIPSRKEIIAAPELVANELYTQALDQMRVGKPMPVNTEMRWIWDAMRPAYQGIFTNQISPEKAAEEMQLLAEKLIAENRE